MVVVIFLHFAFRPRRVEKGGTPLSEEFETQLPDKAAPQPEAPHRPGAELFEWFQMIMGCILTAVVVFNCFARLTRVDGSSMENTLQDGEMMLVWSLGYEPKQGDIVVVNKTTAPFVGWDGKKAIVKRVIAVGGQTVDIDYTEGVVYVDGEALDEPYIKEEMYNTGDLYMQQTHWEVPDGSVFVMGDNRNHSTDSRHDYLGCIDHDYVLGKVILALWPPTKFGTL